MMKMIFRLLRLLSLVAILFSASIFAYDKVNYTIPDDGDVILNFGSPSRIFLPRRMNILIWNLHKGENAPFARDFMTLAKHKDLVLSQEMYLDPLMLMVFNSFPDYFYVSATSFFMGKNLFRTGVATASPVHPTHVDYVRTEVLEPVIDSPKVTLITRYPILFSTKKLTVVNIHGINFVDDASYRKEIDRLVESLKNIPSPLIFAGDFNSWSDGRNAILREMGQKLKLTEAQFFPDFRMKFNNHPLDHFYHTSDLKVVFAKVEDFYQGSDHRPLEVVVEY